MDFGDVVRQRHSCRGYLPEEVPAAERARLFALAQRAPSWCNTQPWQVHVTTGAATRAFAEALTEHVLTHPQASDLAMPAGYDGVYADRRRESGYALYESLGIERSDHEARRAQALLNYSFFGAPHVAVVTTDRSQGVYGAIDCGGFVATLTLAAQSMGLGSVAQAAIAMHSDFVRDHLGLPRDRLVVCAVSFGRPDPEHPANRFRTSRAPLEEVVVPVGASGTP